MAPLPFRKLHGLGNDFIVVDGITGHIPSGLVLLAPSLCRRNTGVGADGLLLMLPPQAAGSHARMRVINADGSEPEMCGNGIRCVAKVLHDHLPDFAQVSALTIDTGAGPLTCDLTLDPTGRVQSVRVDMGRPSLDRESLPMQGTGTFIEGELDGSDGRRWTAVSMGNPHIVTFVDDAGQDLRALAEQLGPRMERHPMFPARTNVEFVRMGAGSAEVWVWERGCGITQACGTGACAVAVACEVTHRHPGQRDLEVRLPGGTLRIEVAPDRQRVWMDGPVAEVFSGLLDLL